MYTVKIFFYNNAPSYSIRVELGLIPSYVAVQTFCIRRLLDTREGLDHPAMNDLETEE